MQRYRTAVPAGKAFPLAYTWDLKNAAARDGRIGATGCPELPF